jgi:hypothetical protein
MEMARPYLFKVKMPNCETCNCNGQSEVLKKRIISDLNDHGINFDFFNSMPPKERFYFFKERYCLDEELSETKSKTSSELGLVVVKPELFNCREVVENYLEDSVGVEIVEKKDFVYTPKQFWQIYGEPFSKYFNQFPHGPLLTLIASNSLSRLILFKQPTSKECFSRYAELSGKKINIQADTSDPYSVFDDLFINNGKYSLRKQISQPILEKKGFALMKENSCPATCWDFTGIFSKLGTDNNLRTFNGIHGPCSKEKLNKNLQILNVHE